MEKTHWLQNTKTEKQSQISGESEENHAQVCKCSHFDDDSVSAVRICFILNAAESDSHTSEYPYWSGAGKKAGDQALAMMKQNGITPQKENLTVLTNAGYAEIENSCIMGFIDGISDATGCRRGNNAFAEIHSRYDAPLWCAVYDKVSGICAYLQMKSSKISGEMQTVPASEAFEIAVTEKINADHLFANADAYQKKFAEKIFGGNEFRVVTIANALAKGVPSYVLRAFEYHDH